MKTLKIDYAVILIWMLIIASCSQADKQDMVSTAPWEDDLLLNDTIASTSSMDNLQRLDTVEIIRTPHTDKVHLEIRSIQKNWFEDIFLVPGNKSESEVPVPLTSQSVLHAGFVDLQKNNAVFFEVYDITHMGNGFYNLFEYKNGQLRNVLTVRAVDRHQEGIGLTADSSFIIQNDRLDSEYSDLNGDGFLDVTLSGIGYVVKGDIIGDEEKLELKNPIRLERQFVWNRRKDKFEEAVEKKVGFWYYDKYGIEY